MFQSLSFFYQFKKVFPLTKIKFSIKNIIVKRNIKFARKHDHFDFSKFLSNYS